MYFRGDCDSNKEIDCDEVKEFKVLDENSKPFKTSSALKKTGGAVVGGLLTGGVGAISEVEEKIARLKLAIK